MWNGHCLNGWLTKCNRLDWLLTCADKDNIIGDNHCGSNICFILPPLLHSDTSFIIFTFWLADFNWIGDIEFFFGLAVHFLTLKWIAKLAERSGPSHIWNGDKWLLRDRDSLLSDWSGAFILPSDWLIQTCLPITHPLWWIAEWWSDTPIPIWRLVTTCHLLICWFL